MRKTIKLKYKWYGSFYGGFYVCPDFLDKNSIVYSFGIGKDISFDEEIIKNHNCHVFGFDPTPKSIEFIKNSKLPENFHFYDFGIANKNGFVDFYIPLNKSKISGSIIIREDLDLNERLTVKVKTLRTIMDDLGHEHIDLLKMDIEGAEYDVIENILNSKISVNQFLIEFHDRFFQNGEIKTEQAICMLKDNGYEIFAVSDRFAEVSLINRNIL